MDILKKYRVFCITENTFIETWKHIAPSCCPTDYRHEIDPAQTVELEQMFIETPNIQAVTIHSKSFRNTNGMYRAEGFQFDIPANSNVYVEDYVVPVQFCIFKMRLCLRDEHIGDMMSIVVQPETPMGVVTAQCPQGTTTVSVTDTVVYNAVPGFYVNIQGEERQILSVDKTALTITVDAPFTNTVEPSTYVLANVYVFRKLCLDAVGFFDIGDAAYGGKVISNGSVIRLIYHNNSQTAKRFSFNMEYVY